MHSFNGRLKLESFPRASDINNENFIMRGSTIKNIPLPKSNYTNIIKVKKEFSNRSKKFIIINRIY